MKRLATVTAMAAVLMLPGTVPLRAEEPGTDVPSALNDASEKIQAGARVAQRQVQEAQTQVREGIERSLQELRTTKERLAAIVHRGSGADRALVVRSSDTAPEAQAHLEEDLPVMSHILGKAIDEKMGEEPRERTALGINVLFGPATGSPSSLYLDGYGALFLLRVRFPLLPPPAGPALEKDKPSADSTWDEARREVYGPSGGAKGDDGAAPAYDQSKVDRLKDVLMEALKSAANIRGLKPEDSVTVCVSGGRGGREAIPVKVDASGKGPEVRVDEMAAMKGAYFVGRGTRQRETMMTLRARKADIDALAKGKMTQEEFRKRVVTAAYLGTLPGSGGPAFGVTGGSSIGTGGTGGFGGF